MDKNGSSLLLQIQPQAAKDRVSVSGKLEESSSDHVRACAGKVQPKLLSPCWELLLADPSDWSSHLRVQT